MISVICAAYNAEKYIIESVDSVLNQTYKDIEIIVIDDGSTDGTVKLLEKYLGMNNFSLKRNEHSGNVGHILNECISFAKGSIIAVMSADDIWLPDKLEKQLVYANDFDMICTNSFLMYEENKIYDSLSGNLFDFAFSKKRKKHNLNIIIKEFSNDVELDLGDLLRFNYVIAPSVLMNTETARELGCFEDKMGIRGEDYLLWLNFAKRHKIRFINEPLVTYRIHENNLSLASYNERMGLLLRTIEIRSTFLSDSNKNIVKSATEGCLQIYREIVKISIRNKHYKIARTYSYILLKTYKHKVSFTFVKYIIYFTSISVLSVLKGDK